MITLDEVKLYQISFGKDSDLEKVESQLKQLAEDADNSTQEVKYISCFLDRDKVGEMGFSTEIVDLIDEILGDRHIYVSKKYGTMSEFMKNIDRERLEVGSSVDKLYVLDARTAEGVVREIEIFTEGKLVMMY